MDDLIQANGFGPFYCQGVEILRRIFVTVRDRDWREIAPTRWNCKVDEAARTIWIEARHVSELVDFTWAGTLEVSADGSIVRFALEGEAQRTMEVCRLGLVVLHPIETMVGTRISAQGPQGEETLVVAPTIAPQPIIEGIPTAMIQPFSSLNIERADLGVIELRLAGDLFELEDQRNWGDASFKTYCTPLRMGFPRRVDSGTRIAHHLNVRFSPVTRVTVAKEVPPQFPQGPLPFIGCELSARYPSESQALDWHHVHVEWSELPAAYALLQAGDASFEIGVDTVCHGEPPATLLSWITEHRWRVARLLLYGPGKAPPDEVVLARWRRALDPHGDGNLPIYAAARGYFVEFNRRAGESGPIAGLSFPLTATVHADDPTTIAENVATIGDMADTARRALRSTALAVSPLALYHPASTHSESFPDALVAPWLAATLIHAAIAGVASVTLARDLVDRAPTALLHRLIQFAEAAMTLLPQSPRAFVHAAVLHQSGDDETHILAVNASRSPAPLDLGATSGRTHSLVEIRDREVSPIVGTHVELAAFGVHWFRCALV